MTLQIRWDEGHIRVIDRVNQELESEGLVFESTDVIPGSGIKTWELEKLPEEPSLRSLQQRIEALEKGARR